MIETQDVTLTGLSPLSPESMPQLHAGSPSMKPLSPNPLRGGHTVRFNQPCSSPRRHKPPPSPQLPRRISTRPLLSFSTSKAIRRNSIVPRLKLRRSRSQAVSKISGEGNFQQSLPDKSESWSLGDNIPWGLRKVLEVMMLWFVSFVVFRSSIWKMGMWILGVASESDLSAIGQAAFTLFLDALMLAATIFIIGRSLKPYRPFQDPTIFPRTWKGHWWIKFLLALLFIPAVDWLGTHMTLWFPEEVDPSSNMVVVQLSRGDIVPNVLYFVLLAACAPIWEELMFRGFLQQSLGKFVPNCFAVVLSSTAFALMHGNFRQFLPLWALGIIIGQVFVWTRNLLPAILLHSCYNIYVFAHVLWGT